MEFDDQLKELRENFKAGGLKTYEQRKKLLKAFLASLQAHEEAIYTALETDLKKSPEETWLTENGFVQTELKLTIKQLKKWMKPEKVCTNLINLPGSSRIYHEPKGVVLIISPWNYPLNLLFTPFIGAIAAGNTVVLKPSEYTPAISAVMKKIISESFAKNEVLYVEGEGAEVIPALMKNFRFDHIFYTGSTAVGKKIYEAAAKQLIPVTLELGGKSPCVVEKDADLDVAAKRIVFAKFTNSGQTCVAPDYILVHNDVHRQLTDALQKYIKAFFLQPEANGYDYGKIINKEQFDRLVGYLGDGTIIFGGMYDKEKMQIQPTIIEDLSLEDSIMQEEIFGPILPVLSFTNTNGAINIINRNPDPLAFYIFTKDDENADLWINAVPSGGACVNNASVHLINPKLPFGGRGNSGIGSYHGRKSFTTFSHQKSVLKSSTWFDPKLKYPPYKGKLSMFKKVTG